MNFQAVGSRAPHYLSATCIAGAGLRNPAIIGELPDRVAAAARRPPRRPRPVSTAVWAARGVAASLEQMTGVRSSLRGVPRRAGPDAPRGRGAGVLLRTAAACSRCVDTRRGPAALPTRPDTVSGGVPRSVRAAPTAAEAGRPSGRASRLTDGKRAAVVLSSEVSQAPSVRHVWVVAGRPGRF